MKSTIGFAAKLIVAITCMQSQVLFADLVCGTWNLRWFPSGRAEHRASQKVEAAAYNQAADVLRAHVAGARPGDGVIIFLQELRDHAACEKLASTIGSSNLTCACVSGFREWDRRLSWQQCGILTTLPVVEASWSYWRRANNIIAPRGYAYAVVDAGEQGLVACFCVHLKSNYGATKPQIKEQNMRKRELAAAQLVKIAKKLKTSDGRTITHVIIAGDFNTDVFAKRFAGEKTCTALTDAGFANCFSSVPPSGRGTHPGSKRYSDSTLDYIFHRGFAEADLPTLGAKVPVSDHRLVALRLR